MKQVFAFAVLLGIAIASRVSYAQVESALGPCSQNVAGQGNSVTVTCTFNNRIKIAKLSGYYRDEKFDDLVKFLQANDHKIVYLDILTENDFDKTTSPPSFTFLNRKGTNDEGGWLLNLSTPNAVRYLYGDNLIKGFFIPDNIEGLHQGFFEIYIELQDAHRVIYSNKFIFD